MFLVVLSLLFSFSLQCLKTIPPDDVWIDADPDSCMAFLPENEPSTEEDEEEIMSTPCPKITFASTENNPDVEYSEEKRDEALVSCNKDSSSIGCDSSSLYGITSTDTHLLAFSDVDMFAEKALRCQNGVWVTSDGISGIEQIKCVLTNCGGYAPGPWTGGPIQPPSGPIFG